MNYDKIKIHQEELFKIIHSVVSIKNKPKKGILNYLAEAPADDQECFGILGQKLHRFGCSIDLEHPDLDNICDGQITGEGCNNFSSIAIDFLKIVRFIKQNNISCFLLDNIVKFFSDCNYYAHIEKIIDSPKLNQLHARLLKNKEDILSVRSTKKSQSITIENPCNWTELPDNLFNYTRYKNIYEKNIEQAIKTRQNFLEHGLNFMAEAVEKDISKTKNEINKNFYFGFNKISIKFAASVAAKACGFSFEKPTDTSPTISTDRIKHLAPICEIDRINLEAKIYTTQEISDRIPRPIAELIDYLDNFPELQNKPLFDYYRVIIPCVDISSMFNGRCFEYKDYKGNNFEIFDREYYQKIFNLDLIEQKIIVGILLGERDGENFFISYFI